MLPLWLENLLAYSIQIGALLAAAGLALALFRLRLPRLRLWCWQAMLAVCLLLPAIQPLRPAPGDVSITSTSRPGPVASGERSRPRPALPFADLLAGVLIAGSLVRLCFFVLGFARLQAYRRRSRPIQIPRALGIQAEVRASDEIPGPVTFGFLRPVILVPETWAASHPVLYHEWIHVRRGDWLFMVAEEFVRALLWFHPLVWYAIGQIQLAREEVVDREVVQFTQSRERYLETLLAIAAARSGLDLALAPLFLRKRHLRKRVAALMKEGKMSRVRLQCSLAGCLAVTLACGLAVVRAFPLQAAQSASAEEQEKKAAQSASAEEQEKKAAQHPRVLHRAPVAYPPEAKQAGIEGTVAVKIEIDKDGRVADAYAVRGPMELREAALDSVRQWTFSTDSPLPASADIEVRFSLDAGSASDASGQPPIRVGGNKQSENLIKKVTPVYPPEAKAARIQGKVQLKAVIGADGLVKDLELIDGDPILADAAIPAVRQWIYRPTLLNGNPVEVVTQIDVNFTLSR